MQKSAYQPPSVTSAASRNASSAISAPMTATVAPYGGSGPSFASTVSPNPGGFAPTSISELLFSKPGLKEKPSLSRLAESNVALPMLTPPSPTQDTHQFQSPIKRAPSGEWGESPRKRLCGDQVMSVSPSTHSLSSLDAWEAPSRMEMKHMLSGDCERLATPHPVRVHSLTDLRSAAAGISLTHPDSASDVTMDGTSPSRLSPPSLNTLHRVDSLDLLARAAERAAAEWTGELGHQNGHLKVSQSVGNLADLAQPKALSGAAKLRKERPVRPKVIESKGTLQCLGLNRKKKTRCRNAALMEYVGPRPLFCAEHISLDPEAMYSKCAYRLPEDTKGCKEIVFKEFKRCYKHFTVWLSDEFSGPDAYRRTVELQGTVKSLLSQLEQEAAVAKREDAELYQRKSKLIPKYQSMETSVQAHLAQLAPPSAFMRSPP